MLKKSNKNKNSKSIPQFGKQSAGNKQFSKGAGKRMLNQRRSGAK